MIYISDSIFPSFNADSIQVAKTVDALNAAGLDTRLVALSSLTDKGVSSPYTDLLANPKRVKGYLYFFPFLIKKRISREEVIYTRHFFSAIVYANLGYKVFYEIHNSYWRTSPVPSFIVKRGVRRIQGFVSITQFLAQDLVSDFDFINSNKVLVAPDASDTNREKRTIPSNERLNIVYTGSYHRGKGTELIFELANKLPEHDFHLYGGPVPSSIHKEKLPNLHIHGQVDHHDIPPILANADIALLPNQREIITGKKSSNIANYTSPMKLFDYMAAGSCILSSDMPVLREVLDEEVAVLLPCTETSKWVEAIENLNTHREVMKALGTTAKERFEQNHTWRHRATLIKEFIDASLA